MPATFTGWFILLVTSGFEWGRSSWRHRAAFAVAYVGTFVIAETASTLLPSSLSDRWYVASPVCTAASLLAVAGYVAISRLPGFEPPPPAEDEVEVKLVPLSPAERQELLGPSGQRVFRRAHPLAAIGGFFAVVAVVSLDSVVAGALSGVWYGSLLLAAPLWLSARAVWLTPQLAVIADADGILVRNFRGIGRIPWANVKRIVPPPYDTLLYTRIDTVSGKKVRCRALSVSIFEPEDRLNSAVAELEALAFRKSENADPVRA